MTTDTISANGRAALAYRREDRRPIPLCSPKMGPHKHKRDSRWIACDDPGKVPLIRWKEFQNRPPTEAEVIGWWERWPLANIAEVLGRGRGRLDVDPRNGGDESLAEFQREHGPLPDSVRILTGGGGEHIELTYDGYLPSRGAILPGLDWKADGGYGLLPDSLHASGRPYSWEASSHPDDVPVAPAPAALIALVAAPARNGSDRPRLELELVLDGIPEGERDETIFRFACKMRADDVPIEYALLLARLAARQCSPPFDEERAAEKVSRAYGNFKPTPQIRVGSPAPGGDDAEACIACGAPPDWRTRLAACDAREAVILAQRAEAERLEAARAEERAARLEEARLERAKRWGKTMKAVARTIATEAVSGWSRGIEAPIVHNVTVAAKVGANPKYVGGIAAAVFDRPGSPIVREKTEVPRGDGSGLTNTVYMYRWNADGSPSLPRAMAALADLAEAEPERPKGDPKRCPRGCGARQWTTHETTCEACGSLIERTVTRRKDPGSDFLTLVVHPAPNAGGPGTLGSDFLTLEDHDDARAAAMVAIPIVARNGTNGHGPQLPSTWVEWAALGDAAPRCRSCREPLYASAGDSASLCKGCAARGVAP